MFDRLKTLMHRLTNHTVLSDLLDPVSRALTRMRQAAVGRTLTMPDFIALGVLRQLQGIPTLRNVALTYPYFHDGAADTLGEAVEIMGRIQLGKKFTPEENAQIVAFLKTLTGDQPSFQLPILPPSSDKTPRPHPFN